MRSLVPPPLILLIGLPACGGASTTADLSARPEALRQEAAATLTTGARCAAVRLGTEPDLFGWDTGSRAKLVSIAAQGLAVVRYEVEGCDVNLTVLPRCISMKEQYEFTSYTEVQTKSAEDERSLYANFPIAAGALRARLASGKGIRADYHLSGIQRVPVGRTFSLTDLRGDCQGATHVVSAVYRGVFVVGAGEHEELKGSASLLGGAIESELQILDRAGDPQRCQIGGKLLPGCDVPLRLELTPIEGGEDTSGVASVEEDRSRPPPPSYPTDGRRCPAGMAAIPGGPFMMGSDSLHRVSKPAHRVTVGPFCLDLTEVTVGAYQRCVEASVCHAVEPSHIHKSCFGTTEDLADFPRNCIDWPDARTYCEWANKRLPTEAEWEFAARGGDRSLRYPWGNEPPSDLLLCWKRTIPNGDLPCRVGSFPPEAFGLRDVGGNLQEWTWDWYGPHQAGPAVDPTGPAKGRHHVGKGGYWLTESDTLPAGAWRSDGRGADVYTGVRCARDR